MERKLGYAILAAVVTFAILQYGIGAASFKPSSTLIPAQSIDPAQLRTNATLYATVAAFFVGGLALVFSSIYSSGDAGGSSEGSSAAARMQDVAKLKEKGLISEEEFKAKRAEILKLL